MLPDVLELVLRGIPDASVIAPAFLREPSKHIELRFIGQAIFVFLSLIPAAISIAAANESLRVRDAQKYQRSTSKPEQLI